MGQRVEKWVEKLLPQRRVLENVECEPSRWVGDDDDGLEAADCFAPSWWCQPKEAESKDFWISEAITDVSPGYCGIDETCFSSERLAENVRF